MDIWQSAIAHENIADFIGFVTMVLRIPLAVRAVLSIIGTRRNATLCARYRLKNSIPNCPAGVHPPA